MTHLDQLESEAIYVIREALSNAKNPVVLFSGGKDSICVSHLALKAMAPSKLTCPFLHVDTGHNFAEAINFRDKFIKKNDLKLLVASVEDYIKKGLLKDTTGAKASRNLLQTMPLLETIKEHKFDIIFGGARRDEEKARAKERFFSLRDDFGGWNPKSQRPELWMLYNTYMNQGENLRVFPLSNWTESDVWEYIKRENINVPEIYFAHERKCIQLKDGRIMAISPFVQIEDGEKEITDTVRFRTVGDMTCTAAFKSTASNVDEIIKEINTLRTTERGARLDDEVSESAMEDRKKDGYF